MTTQSLKNQLFTNLKSQGYQDDLKKQLRAKIISQLKDKNLLQTKNQKKLLLKRVLSSLIMQSLQQSQFQYTQSVYSVESGFQDAFITRNELIQLMTLKSNQIKQNQSLLEYILKRNQPFSSQTRQNIEIQTNTQDVGFSLEQKLMMVDQQYRNNLISKENYQQNHIYDKQKFQLQFMEKTKKQFELFKQFQSHKIKIKVGQQWRKKSQIYSNQISEQYRRKYDLLRKKQKSLNQEMILKNKQVSQKQNFLQKSFNQKISLLQTKSTILSSKLQLLTQQKTQFTNMAHQKQTQLFNKQKQYDSLLLNIKQKIKYQVNLVKLVLQQQNQDKQMEMLRRKKIVDQDYTKLMGIKDSIDIVQRENQRLAKENLSLRDNLTHIQLQLNNNTHQLSNKLSKLEQMKDDLVESEQRRKALDDKIKQQIKKSKRYQSDILSMRQQLQTLRQLQPLHQIRNQSIISQISSPQDVEIQQKSKIKDINNRLQRIKNQRRKDIQKMKMEL